MKNIIARFMIVMQLVYILCMYMVLLLPFERRHRYVSISHGHLVAIAFCVAGISLAYLYYFFYAHVYIHNAFVQSVITLVTVASCAVAWYALFQYVWGYDVHPYSGIGIILLSLVPPGIVHSMSFRKNDT